MARESGKALFAAADPRGRVVTLTQERWEHICEEHREVRQFDVKRAIETAEERTEGAFGGAEKLWARNVGPARWFVVVVAYSGRTGEVLTAYGSGKGPRPERRL